MKRTVGLALGIMIALAIGCGGGANGEKVKAAVAAAEKWLAISDEGRYGDSWDEGSAYFKTVMTREKWETVDKAIREPLGKLIDRTLSARDYVTSVPGMPEGEYVVIEFTSNFENAKNKEEAIVMTFDSDGSWRPVSSYVK